MGQINKEAPNSGGMESSKWVLLLLIGNVAAICWATVRFCDLLFPMVGHDYRYFIPRIIDTYLHYRINGLTIQWYTPSFGGGLPAFPNPQDLQFALPQMLAFWTGPWKATLLSILLYTSFGLLGGYYFFKRVLGLNWTSSILGAVLSIANGFYMQHMAVGHLGYQAFPLLPFLALGVLDKGIPWPIGGVIFALVMAILVHQAGFYLIVIFGLSLLMASPLVYLHSPLAFSWKRLRYILEWGGILTILLSVSKISAVYSFMRFFPRIAYTDFPTGIIKGFFGIMTQLWGTMTLMPLYRLIGKDPSSIPGLLNGIIGMPYDFWELDTSMSPVAFGILLAGVILFFRNPRKSLSALRPEKKWIALILLIVAAWIAAEFTLAKGWVFLHAHKVPFIRSLQVTTRFASAFIFPLAILAAVIFNRWAAGWGRKKALLAFSVLDVVAIASLGSFFLFQTDLQGRSFDVRESIKAYEAALRGETFTIEAIRRRSDEDESYVFRRHSSSMYPYEPIFGYQLENFHPETREGSIWEVSGTYYNFTNPAGFVFPEVNETRPFERIRVKEKDKLAALASRHQPAWKIPLYQAVFNWVSALAFVLVLVFPVVYGLVRMGKKELPEG
jgi:hypothetical protein